MRPFFALALLLTIIVSAVQLASLPLIPCEAPLPWRIGTIDDRFDISEDTAREVASEATELWEQSSEHNLFVYDEEADFVINFVFDERQQVADQAEQYRYQLDTQEESNEQIQKRYEALKDRYTRLQATYEKQSTSFDTKLNLYNQKVSHYNQNGGAPGDVFEELEAEKQQLDADRKKLNTLANTLNDLVDELNAVSEKGNLLVTEYNQKVNTYNESFAYQEGFTQGDYQGDQINIYKFSSLPELRLVLAHEFGHALTIGHVENERSVMHYLMEAQPLEPTTLTIEDEIALERVCEEKGFVERLKWQFARISF